MYLLQLFGDFIPPEGHFFGAGFFELDDFFQQRVAFVGELRAKNAKAVVVQGATVSLLGQPFLESIDEIVIRKGEMVLRDQRES